MSGITVAQEYGLHVVGASENANGGDLLAWYKNNNKRFREMLNDSGGVLFRGFNISSDNAFATFMQNLPESKLSYLDGNSPRTKMANNVYTSTEFPPEYRISMHNELSYSAGWPDKLYFCCVTAPESDGHTLLADCRKVLEELDSTIVDLFAHKKVMYTRLLHGGLGIGPSWQETFEMESKLDLESYCKDNNIRLKWTDNNSVQLTQIGPGVITHPLTQEQVWFNQADQFHISNLPEQIARGLEALTNGDKNKLPTYAFFGDGEEIPVEMLNEVRRVFKNNTLYFPWQSGDLLVVDNVLMAHGRSPFKGQRKVLVAMT